MPLVLQESYGFRTTAEIWMLQGFITTSGSSAGR